MKLELDYDEALRAEVEMNIVINAAGRHVEVQGTAEHKPFDRAAPNRWLDLAAGSIGDRPAAQRKALAGA